MFAGKKKVSRVNSQPIKHAFAVDPSLPKTTLPDGHYSPTHLPELAMNLFIALPITF